MTRVLVAMVRALPAELLGQIVASLPDEHLETIARAALARLIDEPRREPTAALRRERAAPAARRRRADASDSPAVAAVAKALVGADGALAVSQIVAMTDLTSNAVRYALLRLRAQRRAFQAGRTTSSRWAVTQAAADEAAA